MNRKIKALLFEAFRRNAMADEHERSKTIEYRWLGLGTAAAYRPVTDAGLMAFHHGRNPPARCMGWLVLTPAGVKAMRKLKTEFQERLDYMNSQGYQKSYLAHYSLMGGISAVR